MPITDPNTQFCKILLQQARLDLTGRELAHAREHMSCVKVSDYYLFEWAHADMNTGGTYYEEIYADNIDDARAQGIRKWLECQAPRARDPDRLESWPPMRVPRKLGRGI